MRNLLVTCITLFVFSWIGVSSHQAFAADIYVSQNATGVNTGANCTNAYPASWFNNGSNWGSSSGQIGPGTVVHLCGTITSELAFQGSGSSGNPIELLFEPGAAIQISPGADANGAVNLGGNNYILIDGGANTPCGWNTATNKSEGACNGQIENMLYGSSDATCPGGPCTTQTSTGNLIQGSGNNVEIRNLQAGPSYIHTSTGNAGNDTHGTGCISDNGGSNWNIHDNNIHDGSWCVTFTYSSGTMSGITLTNNEFSNSSHMVAVGGAGSATLNGFTFDGNYAHDMHMWDTTSDSWHADGIHFYSATLTNTAENLLIYNNIFGGNTGQDITAQVYSEEFANISNLVLFNNLFTASDGALWWVDQCNSGCYFLNNTMANNTGTALYLGYSSYPTTLSIENNVIEGSYWLINWQGSAVSVNPYNYNAYGPNGGGVWYRLGSSFNQLSSWQSASGEGSSSIYNASGLSLSASYLPDTGSPVITAGVNVCTQSPTFCTSYPEIKNDLAGNPRPTNGNWNIGAYQNSGSTLSSTPSAPTGLTGVVQ